MVPDMIITGCCGRAGLALADYARRFNAMEIQETFYRIVREGTLSRWRSSLGEGFHITMKAFQGVSHPSSSPTWRKFGKLLEGDPGGYGMLRKTEEVANSWRATEAMASALGAEYVVVQMPPSFEPDEDNLRRIREFFAGRHGSLRIGLEVRGDMWMRRAEELREALEAVDVTHVTDPLTWPPVHVEGPAYFRLHGRLPHYDYQYRTEELLRIVEIAKDFHDAYVFFNNMAMAEDAARLMSALKGRVQPLPGPEERAKLILSSLRVPVDSRVISKRYGYLRVGVEGEPTIGELLRGIERIEEPRDLVAALSRRSGGTCSDRS
ncbi:MAG: DUF72 domain-containing protein [Conexivisphaera sp.]|jgi:uncharacterized protein YecE (DUF72 family)